MKFKCQSILHNVRSISERTGAFRSVWNLLDCLGDLIHNTKPITVKVMVNGKPARALLDSGSLGDFVSSTLVDQISAKKEILESPVLLQLAVQGSRSKVNTRTTLKLEYLFY